MENVLIRECTLNDIDAVLQLDRQWEQENIAHGDFNPISMDKILKFYRSHGFTPWYIQLFK